MDMTCKYRNEVLIFCIALFFLAAGISEAISRLLSCGDDLLRLECRSRSIIAIHSATATTEAVEGNVTCSGKSELEDDNSLEVDSPECTEDLRITVNRRCSGMKRCNYRYGTEVGRKCDSGKSTVVVQYACIRETSIYKYCNTRLRLKEGYIASPGYPLFYPHLTDCRWYVDADDGNVVVFRPLHVHLRPATVIHHDEEYPIRAGLYPDIITCDVDYLRIEEGRTKKYETCGESIQGLREVEVQAAKGASVKLASKEFFPGSGFLMYFRVKGCATLKAHEDMYMVWRNGTDAMYRCLDGRVFNDTMSNAKVLRCVGEHRWNDTINTPCVDVEVVELFTVNRTTTTDGRIAFMENMTNDEAEVPPGQPVSEKRTSYVEDLIVPIVLMTVLIVGNTVIIGVIFYYRRKQEQKRETEIQLQTKVEEEDVDDDDDDVNEITDEQLMSTTFKTTTV